LLAAYAFATAACALVGLRLLERGLQGPIQWMAPTIFVIANVVIGTIFLRTLWFLLRGRLLGSRAMPNDTQPQGR